MTGRLIRLKELLTLVPLSRSTIYERMASGTFPRSRDLGGGVVAWREAEVTAWIDGCPETGLATGENKVGVGQGVSAPTC